MSIFIANFFLRCYMGSITATHLQMCAITPPNRNMVNRISILSRHGYALLLCLISSLKLKPNTSRSICDRTIWILVRWCVVAVPPPKFKVELFLYVETVYTVYVINL